MEDQKISSYDVGMFVGLFLGEKMAHGSGNSVQDTWPEYVWPCLTDEGSGETQKNYGQTCPHKNSIHLSMCVRPFSC